MRFGGEVEKNWVERHVDLASGRGGMEVQGQWSLSRMQESG